MSGSWLWSKLHQALQSHTMAATAETATVAAPGTALEILQAQSQSLSPAGSTASSSPAGTSSLPHASTSPTAFQPPARKRSKGGAHVASSNTASSTLYSANIDSDSEPAERSRQTARKSTGADGTSTSQYEVTNSAGTSTTTTVTSPKGSVISSTTESKPAARRNVATKPPTRNRGTASRANVASKASAEESLPSPASPSSSSSSDSPRRPRGNYIIKGGRPDGVSIMERQTEADNGDVTLTTTVNSPKGSLISATTINEPADSTAPDSGTIRIRRRLPDSITGNKRKKSIKSERSAFTEPTSSSSSNNTVASSTSASSTSTTSANGQHAGVKPEQDDDMPLRLLYPHVTSSSTATPSSTKPAATSSSSSSSSVLLPLKKHTSATHSTSLASPNHSPTVNSDTLAQLGRDVVCSICLDLMIDCVTATCSHSYCRYCIQEWRQTSGGALATQFQCPVCRASITEPVPVNLVNSIIDRLVPQLLSPAEQQARKKRIEQIAKLSKKQTNKEKAARKRQEAAAAGAYTSGGARGRGQHRGDRRIRLRNGRVINSIDNDDMARGLSSYLDTLDNYNSDSDPEYHPTGANYSEDERLDREYMESLDEFNDTMRQVIAIDEDSDNDITPTSSAHADLQYTVDKPRVAVPCDRCRDPIAIQTRRFNVKRRNGSSRVLQRYHSECFAGTPHARNLQLDQLGGFDRLTAEEVGLLRFLFAG